MVKVSEFDPSEFLDDEELIAEYLTAALGDENPDVFLVAVGNGRTQGNPPVPTKAFHSLESKLTYFNDDVELIDVI
jgi:hypothetical protein